MHIGRNVLCSLPHIHMAGVNSQSFVAESSRERAGSLLITETPATRLMVIQIGNKTKKSPLYCEAVFFQ